MTLTLPDLNPIPADIDQHIRRLLDAPKDPAIGEWLLELIKGSSHRNTGEDLHWRLLAVVWLAMEYDTDTAWTYLMWLNMSEPVMSGHFSEMFIEAVDYMEAHVNVANWQAQATDERLVTFFKDFRPIPAQRKMKPLMRKLLVNPTRPETGVWLAAYCRGTADNNSNFMRSWRLLAAAWYAAAFNSTEEGLSYLQTLVNKADRLPPNDNKLLMDAANEADGLAAMTLIIADCRNPTIKTMLKDFGHPDLPILAQNILDSPPNYSHLTPLASQATADAETFQQNLAQLEQAGILPKHAVILDLACGPLATQTLLLTSAGYKTLGVDLNIPPGYLPLPGAKAWFTRNKHTKVWKEATHPYYQALAQQVELKLKWNKVRIQLADLTRLEAGDNSFDAVICTNHLQHAPDVNGLLAETARVLKPGGLLLADIRPYATLSGAFQNDLQTPWGHLRGGIPSTAPYPLNKWREKQFQEALGKFFILDQWLPKVEPQAQAQLTADIRAELVDYSEEELTRRQILVVARK